VGFGEVVDTNLRGIGAASGSAAGDDGDVVLTTGCEEVAFGADGVDGIDDGIGRGGEEVCRRFLGVEDLLDGRFGLGVDEVDPFGESGCLGSADGFGGGVDLAVGIGDAEVIEIDESEFSDTGAGEGFCGPRPHATQANDHDVASGEFFEGGESVKPGNASEAVEKVVGHGKILCPRCGLNKSEDSDKGLRPSE